MEINEEDKESISAFFVFFHAYSKKELCSSKKLQIPEIIQAQLTHPTGELTFSQSDCANFSPESLQDLLFAVAVLIQNSPKFITKFSMNNVKIPTSLMNTYSVALQVFFLTSQYK